eukprot:7750728-Alexandrium_andersonii.AAC.1
MCIRDRWRGARRRATRETPLPARTPNTSFSRANSQGLRGLRFGGLRIGVREFASSWLRAPSIH